MNKVTIDDVTLRILERRGANVDAWLWDLPTLGMGVAPSGDGIDEIADARINAAGSGTPFVYDTRIRLSTLIRYTRCAIQPGPQLVIAARWPSTVKTALAGRAATDILDHHALRGSTIRDAFGGGEYVYVNLDMPMHAVPTTIDMMRHGRR